MSVSLSKTNSCGSKFSGTASAAAVPAIHTGATGATGADAAQPDWTFATPTSVAAGGTPTLSVIGTYPTLTFTFGLVGGEAGGFGAPAITTGAAGSSASILSSGPDTAKVFAFTIPRGDVGAQGVIGNTGTAAGFGTPTIGTGAAGSSASISSSGPDTAKVFAFTIPRGDVGTDGTNGTDGDGWKSSGTGYASGTGIVTFASDDGLGFSTSDLRGADGSDGTNGLGVPSGGTVDQVLVKLSSTDNDTDWVDNTGGHDIVEELGSALTTRTNMTFIGELVEAVDNAVDDSTDILINAKTAWLYG